MSKKELIFFDHLRERVRAAFDASDVKLLQESKRVPGRIEGHWYYDLCALPILPEKDVLMGINWGVSKTELHAEIPSYPSVSRYSDVRAWSFPGPYLSKIEEHFSSLRNINYFNPCPFRTPDVSYLTTNDWRLGVNSFLCEMLDYIKPRRILLIGKEPLSHLRDLNIAEFETVKLNEHTSYCTGMLKGNAAAYQFVALPRRRSFTAETWKGLFADR